MKTFFGTVLALICAGLGGLQVWVAARRHSDEFFIVRSAGHAGFLSFEFATSPARLRDRIAAVGDRGRYAFIRCLELDYLLTAGYVFIAIGLSGILTAVSRPGLARVMLIAGVVAALADVVENWALHRAASTHPEGGSTAPLAAVTAGLKFAGLMAAVAAFLLWPFRTWFG